MKRLFSKINTRVFVGVFGVSALITAVVGISAYSLLEGVYKRNLRRTLSDVSAMVVNAIGGGSKTELAEAARVCSAFSGKNHMRATLVGADGSVFFDSDRDGAGMQNHLKRREIAGALAGEISHDIRYSQTLKTRMLYLATPAGKQNADGSFPFCARISIPMSDLARAKQMLGLEILGLSAAALALSIIASLIVARGICRPIGELTRSAKLLAAGNKDVPMARCNIEEIGILSDAMRSMSEELGRRINSLHKRNCELDEIFAHMNGAVFICADDGTVLRMNKAAAELFKFPPQAEKPKIPDFFRNINLIEAIDKTFAEKQPVHCEIELSEGKTFALASSILPYASSRPRALITLHDISKIKEMETLRREFVAGASHELKTPLTALRAAAESLQDADTLEESAHICDIISAESDKLALLVDNMLLLTKLDSAEKIISRNFEKVKIAPIIASAISNNAARAEQNGMDIISDCSDSVQVRGDEMLLTIAVSNLIGNAIKYGKKNSDVKIAATDDGETVRIAVSDNGQGIAPEHAERVFERFYRVDKGRSRALGGTGLGLAIVKHIAIIHSGKVELKSEVGKGSTFTIILKSA